MRMTDPKLFDFVLLVEDDPSHAFIIRRALMRYAAEIVHVPNLSDARSAIASRIPSLIVSDLRLPDASGVGDVAALAGVEREVPLLVLTSSTSLQDAVEAMKHGARDFIVKDFGPNFAEVLGLSLSRLFAALRLEEEKRQLTKEMQTLHIAIENSSDGLAVVDAAGVVRYANTAFRLFSRRCGGAETRLAEMFSPAVNKAEDLAASVRQNLETLSAGAVWHTEVSFCADSSAAFDLSLSAIASAGGQEREYVVWVRDVSDVKRREKFQREILSTTSHDLKGPLGAISLSSELLKDMTDEGDKMYEIALRIGSSAQGAINLIDEFLSARRLREGNFIMKPVRTRIADVIARVKGNYETIAAAKKIAFGIALNGDEEGNLDPLAFERVVSNLLNNAFKFTKSGGRVDLRVERLQNGELRVEVRDTGTGMEASEVQKIFHRFARLDRHADVAGSGLGLFVVKSIVNAHGGKIEVTSKVGEGTAFQIVFPPKPPVNAHGELISLDFV